MILRGITYVVVLICATFVAGIIAAGWEITDFMRIAIAAVFVSVALQYTGHLLGLYAEWLSR